jgi:signal peptidase I
MTDVPRAGGGAPASSAPPAGDTLDGWADGSLAGNDGPPGAPGEPRPTNTPPDKPKGHRRLLSWVVVVLVAIVIAGILRLFVIQTFFVPSASMEPTLMPGDRMLVLKLGYSLSRGAIVVFKHPPRETPNMCSDSGNDDLVKRIIGLPGEFIFSKGNTVYINGKPLSEPWLPKGQPLGRRITPQRIPANYYFMMGDNRPDSCDSRMWGPIPGSIIIGQVFLVVWRNGHPVFDVK